jgi:UDP:flavonoid glycosyltransferase YjiC (YdhE family)
VVRRVAHAGRRPSCRPLVLSGAPRRRRVALVAGPDPGHALPVLGVGAALVARGHEVRLWTGLGHEHTAARGGIDVEQLPLLAPSPEDADIGHRLWTRAGQMAVPLAERLRAFAADLVLVDTLTRAGAFAAELLGLPWIELIPHHLDDPDPAIPPVGLGRPLARTPWRAADDRRIVRLQRRSYAVGAQQAAGVAAAIGLSDVGRPVVRLIGTLPALERLRARWPPDAHVVGPLAIDPDLPALVPPEGDAPLVVVSDSTATGVDRSLGEVARRALQGLDLRLVVTSGRLPPERRHDVVVGPGPHVPLLAGARLAVGFGGAGFIGKAVTAGVPLVVVPLQGDQREGAARLLDVGAARALPVRRLTPRRLRWAVVRALADHRLQAAAAARAREAARLGPSVAADLVEEVLDGRVPVATGPADHLRTGTRA